MLKLTDSEFLYLIKSANKNQFIEESFGVSYVAINETSLTNTWAVKKIEEMRSKVLIAK